MAGQASMLGMFGAVLRIARIESGERARSGFTEVNLTSLIDDVAELYRPLNEEKGSRLSLHNAPGIVVRADRDMLFQAVANLVDNAIKYTPGSGRIEISSPRTSEGPPSKSETTVRGFPRRNGRKCGTGFIASTGAVRHRERALG